MAAAPLILQPFSADSERETCLVLSILTFIRVLALHVSTFQRTAPVSCAPELEVRIVKALLPTITVVASTNIHAVW